MRDIVVVGSLNVDLSLVAEKIPQPGETIRAEGLAIGPGGKGLNQAIAAARLGGRVHLVGRVGDDAFAEIPLRALAEAGVDTTYVGSLAGEHTGMASIVVDGGTGENAIAVAGGANRALAPEHVIDALAAFRSSAVLLVQLEAPIETVACALELAREQGLITVLDPAPWRPLDHELLRMVDVLTPNESEAAALADLPVTDAESAAAAGTRLAEQTQGDVVVTLGAQGCVWVSSTGFEHVPAPRVDAIDATGAGDAFNGGLAVGLASEEPLARALRRALATGSASTQRRGAAAAMPTANEVARVLDAQGSA